VNNQRSKSQIRVLIVDDSAFMRTALSRMIASDPDICVAGTASSGNEALQRLSALNPDVITLDVQMPGLDGLQTLQRIMAEFPRPVIMVSSVTVKNAETTFNALAAGAFDYIPKQLSPASLDILHLQHDLIAKIKAAADSRHSREHVIPPRKPPQTAAMPMCEASLSPPVVVAIGISTGGPKALQDILPFLPADIPVPILVVQHMPAGFTAPFAKRLNSLCAVSVCEAAHGEAIQPGIVYIAPAGTHLTVDRIGSRNLICLSDKPQNQLHVPSVDIMMQSVASGFGSLAMGIIMTGMGSDGALGMSAIRREGGLTVGQDEQSCAVYGMPRVCAEMRILDRIVPLSQIPDEILQATHYRKASVG
jgi:two-component system chemotaxis response regulator CheB